jgi:hypothetical protein
MFIHVFDDVSIKRVLEHLNTISDFARYLTKRAEYLRSDKLLIAHGEEELLANYLNIGIRSGGAYDFEPPRKRGADFVAITVQGEWSAYVLSEAYFAKTLADDISKVWDRLINVFTENLLAGTSVAILGAQATVATAEQGLRFMAMENRFSRRLLGDAVSGALRTAMEQKQERYARVIFPGRGSADPKVAYVIMVLAYSADLEERGGLKRGYGAVPRNKGGNAAGLLPRRSLRKPTSQYGRCDWTGRTLVTDGPQGRIGGPIRHAHRRVER